MVVDDALLSNNIKATKKKKSENTTPEEGEAQLISLYTPNQVHLRGELWRSRVHHTSSRRRRE